MATKTPSKLLFLSLSLLAFFTSLSTAVEKEKWQVSAQDSNKTLDTDCGINGMFVFGSSLVDNGNNNYLQNSLAKANYLPYGIDFPLGPSGRFTNGKNVIDILCEHLKLPLIPPFADPSTKGDKIVHGVNYASGASGILDGTGFVAGEVINLNQQIRNFEEVSLEDVESQLGCKSKELLPNYLFVLGTGGNDYSFNYFLRGLNNNVSLQAFTANLISTLSAQIKKLYDLGGRKFVLLSVNPLGCYPMVLARQQIISNNTRCNQPLNQAAQLFNANLRTLVDALKQHMPGSNLVFVNSYQTILEIITDPTSKGFEDAERPCCAVPTLSEGGNGSLCKRGGQTCTDRNSHVFFDGLHPTEAVNVVIASKAFASDVGHEVYPMNVKQLVQL